MAEGISACEMLRCSRATRDPPRSRDAQMRFALKKVRGRCRSIPCTGGRPMKTIAFVIQKGGAGKTTLAYNIAHALALHGRRVLAFDLDPQGSMSKGFLEPEKMT